MVECGVVRTKPSDPMEQRLLKIFSETMNLFDRFNPQIVVLEAPFLGKNVSSALALGRVGGILMLAAAQRELPIVSFSPRTIKASVVGRGSATKEQVQFMIQKLLGLSEPPKPLDASDALAAALCYLNRQGVLENQGVYQ